MTHLLAILPLLCVSAIAQPLPTAPKAIVPPKQAVLAVRVSNGCQPDPICYATNPGPAVTLAWAYEKDCAGLNAPPNAYATANATMRYWWLGKTVTNTVSVGTNTSWLLRLKATNIVHHFQCATGNLSIASSPTGTWTKLNGRTLTVTNPTNPRLFSKGWRATNWVEMVY